MAAENALINEQPPPPSIKLPRRRVTPTTQGTDSALSPLPRVTETFGSSRHLEVLDGLRRVRGRILSHQQRRSPSSSSNSVPIGLESRCRSVWQKLETMFPFGFLGSRCRSVWQKLETMFSRQRHDRLGAGLGFTVFEYSQLQTATEDFSTDNCLGEGGFGAVYRGVLSDGKIVAVKLLKNESIEGHDNFCNEVKALCHANHKNIVSLIGYCTHADKRLIVFEFVDNNSLHHHLHGGDEVQVLDWAKRVKIAQGTGKGLAYLHEGCPRTIIHRDVKSANILLDSDFQAKVADFGIAKLCSDSFVSGVPTQPAGTLGYADPEYFQTNILTPKSDVYSFGVVLLELVSGRPPQRVHELVSKLPTLRKRNFKTLVDPRLKGVYKSDELTLMVACAEACLAKKAEDRPLMKEIVHVLEGVTSPAGLKKEIKSQSGGWKNKVLKPFCIG